MKVVIRRLAASLFCTLFFLPINESSAQTRLADDEPAQSDQERLSQEEGQQLHQFLSQYLTPETMPNVAQQLRSGLNGLQSVQQSEIVECADDSIRETEDSYYIDLPSDGGIRISLRVRKSDGKIKVVICGVRIGDITLPCLTYWIRPADGDIVDDLPWPFETTFCRFERRNDGAVYFDCDFDYFGIEYKGRMRIYIEGDQLCRQEDNNVPVCVPLTTFPLPVREIWRKVNPTYLPTLPPEHTPSTTHCPRDMAPLDESDPNISPLRYMSSGAGLR